MNYTEQIKSRCAELEEENDFTILFAVESGSRLWGMESKDSDYDVHLVYYYPIEKYLEIQKPIDTFTWMSCNRVIDLNGFDIYKYAKLLLKSNPNMIDWTMSDIVYFGDKSKISEFIDFAKNHFNPYTLCHSYIGISKNALKLIEKGKNHYKKYLYVLRGILNAQWLTEKKTLPPFHFETVVKELDLSPQIRKNILHLLEKKRLASENSEVKEALDVIHQFAEERLEKSKDLMVKFSRRKPDESHFETFNTVIHRIIGYKSE